MAPTTPTRRAPTQRRFTVDEYYRMGEAGVFAEDDRVELLDGQVYAMTPIGSEHASCVDRLTRLFVLRVGRDATVRVQNPIRLSEQTEPEPDLALLTPRTDDYASHHPRPDDVRLVVEVADTSLSFDREVKLPLYAEAGLPEVWIVDLDDECVEVCREPRSDGYAETRRYARSESVPVKALPSVDPIGVDEILGPTEE